VIDIFISHAWRFHPEWVSFSTLIETKYARNVRNFSLPWHDPAISATSEYGKGFLTQQLLAQIQPVSTVFILESLLSAESNLRWLKEEIKLAKELNKILILIGSGETADRILDQSFEWHHKMLPDQVGNYLTTRSEEDEGLSKA